LALVRPPLGHILFLSRFFLWRPQFFLYVRGLALLHALIETRRTGKADIPGWLLNEFPLDLIEQLRIAIASYKSQDIIDGELQTDQVVEVPAPKHRKK